ncbi:MAG: hypothetical protein ACQCN6_13860 [Candidatus Bathyarchaeia archaeon]
MSVEEDVFSTPVTAKKNAPPKSNRVLNQSRGAVKRHTHKKERKQLRLQIGGWEVAESNSCSKPFPLNRTACRIRLNQPATHFRCRTQNIAAHKAHRKKMSKGDNLFFLN